MCSASPNTSLPAWATKLQFLHLASWDFGSARRQQAHWLCLELQREPAGWSLSSLCENLETQRGTFSSAEVFEPFLSWWHALYDQVFCYLQIWRKKLLRTCDNLIFDRRVNGNCQKKIKKLSYPQDSHMAIPGTVLGLLHHTCPSLVEHVAHLIVDSPVDEPYKDVSSSSTLDLSPIRILPKEGAPRVLFWRAWDTLTRRCCRRASFSSFSLLFFQI